MTTKMPTYQALMNPVLSSLKSLGGSGTVQEIYETVIERESLSEELTSVLQNPARGSQTRVAYRLAWARTYLKKVGFLENSEKGVWSLTALGKKTETVNSRDVARKVRQLDKATASTAALKEETQSELEDPNQDSKTEPTTWREHLHQLLIEEMTPEAFERLTKRILRESGFIQVEITGKTGDGGIDGKGVVRINGLLNFSVVFQCKKYRGSVSSAEIRNFRGAMAGRADKGLFITTGTFTASAVKEATRDGADPIDLVDGEQLATKLKELKLGIKTRMVEEVTVDRAWFLDV